MGSGYIRVCSSPSDFRRQRVLFGSHQGLYSMWNVWESNTGNRTEFFCFSLIKIHDFLRRRFLFSLLPYRLFSVTWSAALQIGHFRVSPGLCLKTRLSAQPLIWKWIFILMQIKLIFTTKVEHLVSFWKRGFSELGSGLLLGIKESFNMWKEFNSHIIFFVHKHGRRFIVLYTNMAAVTSFENDL